jgi:hypothetical protein
LWLVEVEAVVNLEPVVVVRVDTVLAQLSPLFLALLTQ